MNLTRYVLTKEKTVADAISVLEILPIALVEDENSRLIGVITDGDIRNALLTGIGFDENVQEIMNCKYLYVREEISELDAIDLMKKEKIYQLPVVNCNHRVVRLIELKSEPSSDILPNIAVIMAGGLGKRLLPLTADCPKPMLMIGDKPILEIILERCIEVGIRKFYISVNYLKEQIKDHFEDGKKWNVSIHYIEEDKPLGTVGALSLLPFKFRDPLIVINGDILSRVNYARLLDFHSHHASLATICVRRFSMEIPYGVVKLDKQRVIGFEEKPQMLSQINAGIYVLNPESIDFLKVGNYCDMPELLTMLALKGGNVNAFPLHEDWLDIGDHEMLRKAQLKV